MNKHPIRTGLEAGILVVLFFWVISACAQDDILGVDERLAAMKTELNLTQAQADAVKPIIEEYTAKRQQVRDDTKGQVSIDKNAILNRMEQLREEENRKLNQVLTPDQMKQWNNKQKTSDFLNRDQARDTGWEPRGSGMSPGVNF